MACEEANLGKPTQFDLHQSEIWAYKFGIGSALMSLFCLSMSWNPEHNPGYANDLIGIGLDKSKMMDD